MPGKLAQHLGLLLPMFVELRGQLYEVREDAGPGQGRIDHVRKDPMKAVAEFVEQRPRVVRRQQRRLTIGTLGEIADVDDERRYRAVERLLIPQRRHPGPRTLRGPSEVVPIE